MKTIFHENNGEAPTLSMMASKSTAQQTYKNQ